MSDSTIGQIDPYDGMDLGAYRYAVARLLRLLIRARLTQESEFLSEDDRQRWQEKLIEPDSQTIESLLHEVCRANDFLYNQVLGPGNSVGIAPGDSRDQLKENVISVMTSLWSVLDEWIVNATKGEQIKWDDVIPIDSVRLIRLILASSFPWPKTIIINGSTSKPCHTRYVLRNWSLSVSRHMYSLPISTTAQTAGRT